VAGGFQNVVGDGNESRSAHAAARPPVRNQYASTPNKEPRPRPSVERPAVVRDTVQITDSANGIAKPSLVND
jgi:hypothetical protein